MWLVQGGLGVEMFRSGHLDEFQLLHYPTKKYVVDSNRLRRAQRNVLDESNCDFDTGKVGKELAVQIRDLKSEPL